MNKSTHMVRRLLIWVAALCVWCCFVSSLYGQVYPYREYSTKNGLASNWVNDMIQDRHGYLWIGTAQGMSKFDGVTFRNFTTADGLPHNFIYQILESKAFPGTLWLATGGGLCKFDHEHAVTYRPRPAEDNNIVLWVCEANDGTILCGTYSGFYVLNGDTLAPVLRERYSDACLKIIQTGDDMFWVSTRDGLYQYSRRNGTLTHFASPGAPRGTINDLLLDGDGNLWAASTDFSITRIRDNRVIATLPFKDCNPNTIVQYTNHSILCEIDGFGIIQIHTDAVDPGKYSMFSRVPKAGEATPLPLVLDREDNLWLANPDRGILELHDPSILSFPLTINTYPLNNSATVLDTHGRLWIVTGTDLIELWRDTSGSWQQYPHSIVIDGKHSILNSVRLDRLGRIWMKTIFGEIACYDILTRADGGSLLHERCVYRPGKDYPRTGISDFIIDRLLQVWISANAVGVIKVASIELHSPQVVYDSSRGFGDESARALFQDSRGNIWMGGNDRGLGFLPADSLLTGHVRMYTTSDGLPHNYIRAITEDHRGMVWVGTRYGGAAYFRNGRFESVSTKDGLLADGVFCLSAASDSSMWLGMEAGLQRIESFAGPQLFQMDFFRGTRILGITPLPGGLLCVATADGVHIYDPRLINRKLLPPTIEITDIEAGGKQYAAEELLEFPPDQHEFTISFAGICFRDPTLLRYQYRLDGGSVWSRPAPGRSVTLAQLAPGMHSLEVRAISSEGLTSPDPAVVHVRIVPPFWQRWWFYSIVIVFFATTVTVFVRLRIERRRQVNRLRAKISQDLHDDVGSNLTGIAIALKLAQDRAAHGDMVPQQLADISRTVLTTVNMMRDIVWLINPVNDSADDLIVRMRQATASLVGGCQVDIRVTDGGHTEKIDLEIKRNIYLMYKELLANISRHASAKTVSIEISANRKMFRVTIADDGIGFIESSDSMGNGLRNLRSRAKAVNGELQISSTPGKGTVVSFSVPIT